MGKDNAATTSINTIDHLPNNRSIISDDLPSGNETTNTKAITPTATARLPRNTYATRLNVILFSSSLFIGVLTSIRRTNGRFEKDIR